MSATARRRRAFLLLSLALACGGLAASLVRDRVEGVEARVGPLVAVMVGARDLRAGSRVRAADAALRQVPERFVPRDAAGGRGELVGQRTTVPVPAGSYLTLSQLRGGGPGPGRAAGALRRGERTIEVAVAGGAALSEGAAQGSRVDVVISTEGRDGGGRTRLALEDVELLALRPGTGASAAAERGGGGGAAETASAVASLRVTLRQALYLTAAQNFAREVRLLPRPPEDRSRTGQAGVGAGEL